MKVLEIEIILDGGTAEITTDGGTFFCDRRLFTDTKGKIYSRYPDAMFSRILDETLTKSLAEAIREYAKSESNKYRGYDILDVLLKDMGS
jgi:hypothetical protein